MSSEVQTQGTPQDVTTEVVHTAKEAHSEGNALLKLDPGVSIWTLVTFVLLLAVLRKFAWRPILESLDSREKFIKSSMESAEQARQDSLKSAEKQKEILAEARSEAAQVISQTKKDAEELRRSMEQTAVEEKKKILDSAEKEIHVMKETAIRDLKQSIAHISIGAAEKILVNEIDSGKSKKLVDDYIEKLEV